MAKDPAALMYISNWLAATKGMKADCRGWYLNLVLHQYLEKSLPDDLEELANLADVRISEYARFEQVWQQVLKHKFKQVGDNRLQDPDANDIIREREGFVEKRKMAGKMSAFIKLIRKEFCQDENVIFFIKQQVDPQQILTDDKHLLKQVFEQMYQLYIDIDIGKNKGKKKGGVGEGEGESHAPPWSPMPGKEQHDLELPEIKAGCSQELMALAGTEATIPQIYSLWKNFKILHFTGKKFYQSEEDAFSHFINWSKTQKINGTKPNRTNGKSAGAAQLIESLRADLTTGGKPNLTG